MGEKVAVLGAGVAGMTAAHELAERGFEVHVYERRGVPGGRARSLNGPNGLPVDYGFRFLPGFDKHLRHTMARIPYPGERRAVRGNLKFTTDVQVLRRHSGPIAEPTRLYRWDAVWNVRRDAPPSTGWSRLDRAFLGDCLRDLLKACPERRFAEYELESWWDFAGALDRSDQHRRMVSAMTRSLVAARADELSVRTGGYILMQLQANELRWRGHIPSVLNGPTSTVWIEPWRQYLERLGVRFHFRQTVREIRCLDGRIQEVIIADDTSAGQSVYAHWYVAALPAEVMWDLVTPAIKRADPGLANLGKLRLVWMNFVVFYLRTDVPMVHGQTIYVDSPWALTSISQRQFWDSVELGYVGEEKVSGILSVNVSDWERPGIIYNKPARMCTRLEIVNEVLAQIREHLAGTDWAHALDDENIVFSFIDDDIFLRNPAGAAVNLESLLINTPGSWAHRPGAVTKIDNLFLASDYVRTYTDLATMEGANEAARRAVNGILDRSHSTQPRCDVWPLRYPGGLFALWRRRDRSRLKRANRPAFEQAAELIKQLSE